eukprot:TRINITY_DN3989_c0_g3_i2.p1 TRINITY_DN3989_c0_g3~~TRINITY_DN3989_c0_g3_i2.p1  ORF type:complete len:772 (+),score=126.71 TRINITY_DN3989_c0_g3_i2:133-2316(+)
MAHLPTLERAPKSPPEGFAAQKRGTVRPDMFKPVQVEDDFWKVDLKTEPRDAVMAKATFLKHALNKLTRPDKPLPEVSSLTRWTASAGDGAVSVTVENAGSSGANGTYVRLDQQIWGSPVYQKPGTCLAILKRGQEGVWVIADLEGKAAGSLKNVAWTLSPSASTGLLTALGSKLLRYRPRAVDLYCACSEGDSPIPPDVGWRVSEGAQPPPFVSPNTEKSKIGIRQEPKAIMLSGKLPESLSASSPSKKTEALTKMLSSSSSLPNFQHGRTWSEPETWLPSKEKPAVWAEDSPKDSVPRMRTMKTDYQFPTRIEQETPNPEEEEDEADQEKEEDEADKEEEEEDEEKALPRLRTMKTDFLIDSIPLGAEDNIIDAKATQGAVPEPEPEKTLSPEEIQKQAELDALIAKQTMKPSSKTVESPHYASNECFSCFSVILSRPSHHFEWGIVWSSKSYKSDGIRLVHEVQPGSPMDRWNAWQKLRGRPSLVVRKGDQLLKCEGKWALAEEEIESSKGFDLLEEVPRAGCHRPEGVGAKRIVLEFGRKVTRPSPPHPPWLEAWETGHGLRIEWDRDFAGPQREDALAWSLVLRECNKEGGQDEEGALRGKVSYEWQVFDSCSGKVRPIVRGQEIGSIPAIIGSVNIYLAEGLQPGSHYTACLSVLTEEGWSAFSAQSRSVQVRKRPGVYGGVKWLKSKQVLASAEAYKRLRRTFNNSSITCLGTSARKLHP